ncbi:hypothetical protein ACI2K4_14980 [Micromonospora sp. NPDC050397]|uniref:hypothetical protein n=1 Tax=Micromonospora sp. NPDC050397 TaxID=3364279 RepID=UPI0038501A3C
MSAYLENASVFRTAKGGGPAPTGPAVLVLRRRPDFDRRDFDRKARDLKRLGERGKLSKTKPNRTTVYDKTTGKMRSRTNVFRDRIIRKLTRTSKRYQDNKSLVQRLYGGKKSVTGPGQGLDPDHVHELQLGGADTYRNLRLVDSWTNRELGREISQALKDVPIGTKVIVKVVP